MTAVAFKDIPSSFKTVCYPETVFKFGGSSLSNAKSFRKVARLIEQQLTPNDAIVVSASGSTTDWLLAIAHDQDVAHNIEKLRYHHYALLDDLFVSEETHQHRLTVKAQIDRDLLWLESTSHLRQSEQLEDSEQLTQKITKPHLHDILALGECWSAQLLCHFLESKGLAASWSDARHYLKLTAHHQVDFESSKRYLRECIKGRQHRLHIITGFIASDCEGNTLTLGRNGSDLTATVIAKLCGVKDVTLWTDVPGIYEFDPNIDHNAEPLQHIHQQLIAQLSSLGSPVLHWKTLEPISNDISNEQVTLTIRSTFAPELKGTTVSEKAEQSTQTVISHKNALYAIQVTFEDELTCHRNAQAWQSLIEECVTGYQVLIRLSSTEICVLCDEESLSLWLSVIKNDGQENLSHKHSLLSEPQKAERKQQSPGRKLTVKQGATLALVTDSKSTTFQHQFLIQFLEREHKETDFIKVLPNAVIAFIEDSHIDEFAQQCFEQWKQYQTASTIFLLGTGNVGNTWLQQFHSLNNTQQEYLRPQIALTANSRHYQCFIDDKPFAAFSNQSNDLLEAIIQSPFKNKIVIDATASANVSRWYEALFSSGIHLVSANKISSSSDSTAFHALSASASNNGVQWEQNATIGAGLPINTAIKDLLACGDNIEEIRGIFSGTLSWLLSTYDGSQPLHQLIAQAKELGYCEPDPRVDLSGNDVAKKLVIAARLAGLSYDLSDVSITAFLHESYFDGSIDDFWAHKEQWSESFHQQWLQANEKNEVLVYEALLNKEDTLTCGIRSVTKEDPLAQVSPCDNIFVIKTRWYDQNPLIIRGPGAGREVTAAAVQSDVNKILSKLPQKNSVRLESKTISAKNILQENGLQGDVLAGELIE